uniref:Uncharacterized protein n=1 Tax=Triticum urartu TaxID=4572 RepID=A0A8R7PUZ9_TRIUA
MWILDDLVESGGAFSRVSAKMMTSSWRTARGPWQRCCSLVQWRRLRGKSPSHVLSELLDLTSKEYK